MLIFNFHGLGSLLDAHVLAQMGLPLLNVLALLARSTLHLLSPAQAEHSTTHTLVSLRVGVRRPHLTPRLSGVALGFIVYNVNGIGHSLSLAAEAYFIE